MKCDKGCPMYDNGFCMHDNTIIPKGTTECLYGITAETCVLEMDHLDNIYDKYDQLHHKLTGKHYEETLHQGTIDLGGRLIIHAENVHLCL